MQYIAQGYMLQKEQSTRITEKRDVVKQKQNQEKCLLIFVSYWRFFLQWQNRTDFSSHLMKEKQELRNFIVRKHWAGYLLKDNFTRKFFLCSFFKSKFCFHYHWQLYKKVSWPGIFAHIITFIAIKAKTLLCQRLSQKHMCSS